MTKDELKHIFLKSVIDLRNKDLLEQDSLLDVFEDVIKPYISELEQQIEKMKCCENCKYHSFWGDELKCNYGLKEALQEDKLVECKDMNKWEIKK